MIVLNKCVMFSITYILKVFNSHSSMDERLIDFCDGELYKQCELFSQDPCALQIKLYLTMKWMFVMRLALKLLSTSWVSQILYIAYWLNVYSHHKLV